MALVTCDARRQLGRMLSLVLMALAALQTAYADAPSSETYQAPTVRPFEPPSNFGRETAQGDAALDLHRRPLDAPVAVEAYHRSYEASPTDAELAYEQGVAQAQINADALSGPLDGRWRVTDPQGRALLSLALNDRGRDQPAQGAWRTLAGERAAGVAEGVASGDGETVLNLGDRGRLVLSRTADGWSGVLEQDGRRTAVTLGRAG